MLKNLMFVISFAIVFVSQTMQSVAHSHFLNTRPHSDHSVSDRNIVDFSSIHNLNSNSSESEQSDENGHHHDHDSSDCCSVHCGVTYVNQAYDLNSYDFLVRTRFSLLDDSKLLNFQSSIYRPPIA